MLKSLSLYCTVAFAGVSICAQAQAKKDSMLADTRAGTIVELTGHATNPNLMQIIIQDAKGVNDTLVAEVVNEKGRSRDDKNRKVKGEEAVYSIPLKTKTATLLLITLKDKFYQGTRKTAKVRTEEEIAKSEPSFHIRLRHEDPKTFARGSKVQKFDNLD